MLSPLILLAATAGPILPPPPIPEAVRLANIQEREAKYRACLSYATLAWIKRHGTEGDARETAKIAKFNCDETLQKLAVAQAEGKPNAKAEAVANVHKLRGDDADALAVVFSVMADYEDSISAQRPSASDTTEAPHPE